MRTYRETNVLVYCADCTAMRREDNPECFCGCTAYTYELPPDSMTYEPRADSISHRSEAA